MEDYMPQQESGQAAESIMRFEVANLPGGGSDDPPAQAFLILNGKPYETDIESLAIIGAEIKAAKARAKNGVGGRSGTALSQATLTAGVRQGGLFAVQPELAAVASR